MASRRAPSAPAAPRAKKPPPPKTRLLGRTDKPCAHPDCPNAAWMMAEGDWWCQEHIVGRTRFTCTHSLGIDRCSYCGKPRDVPLPLEVNP